MDDQIIKIRLHDLADNIAKDLEVLKLYEDKLRYEDDPKRLMRYRQETVQLRESIMSHQREAEALASSTPSRELQLLNLNAEISSMETRINDLIIKPIITAFSEKLEHTQREITSLMIEAIDESQISEKEMKQMVESTRQALVLLQNHNKPLPKQQEIVGAIEDPKLSTKHKLKAAIPIIPMLLEYQWEMEVGSGMNLRKLWDDLKTKVRK